MNYYSPYTPGSEKVALDFDDVLIVPQPTDISSRSDVYLDVTYTTLHSKQVITGVPIISANMSSVSTFNMATALRRYDMFCALHKHYDTKEVQDYFVGRPVHNDRTFYTLGMNDFHKLEELDFLPKLICIDVANGYMRSFLDFVEKVRKFASPSVIMAGNVVTKQGAKNLYNAGADIVKVGIGSGSVCHTRLVAGVGVPQLTAIQDTLEAAWETDGGLICSDGGITHVGDFSKAFVAGAHFVMAGGIFSGHYECDMPIVLDADGNEFIEYYGMSSEHAMNKHNGGKADYRSSEGKIVRIPYKGSVENTIEHILGGIRSAGSYIGTDQLQDFAANGMLIRVRNTHNKVYGA